jgi:hypothetical protein
MTTLDFRQIEADLLKRLLDIWKEPVGKIAELAEIPEDKRSEFHKEFCAKFNRLSRDNWFHQITTLNPKEPYHKSPGFSEAAKAVRSAKDAVSRLSDDQRNLIQLAMQESAKWVPMPKPDVFLTTMVKAFATIANRSPASLPKGKGSGRGRPKGTQINPVYRSLVEALLTLPKKYDGHLSHHERNRDRGKILAALEILRPYLPGVIPKVPSLKTIATIKSNCRNRA